MEYIFHNSNLALCCMAIPTTGRCDSLCTGDSSPLGWVPLCEWLPLSGICSLLYGHPYWEHPAWKCHDLFTAILSVISPRYLNKKMIMVNITTFLNIYYSSLIILIYELFGSLLNDELIDKNISGVIYPGVNSNEVHFFSITSTVE